MKINYKLNTRQVEKFSELLIDLAKILIGSLGLVNK